MVDKYAFLYAPRFWQLALVGFVAGLNFPFPNNPWVQGLAAMIAIWFGGSVAVRTIDRATEPPVKPVE